MKSAATLWGFPFASASQKSFSIAPSSATCPLELLQDMLCNNVSNLTIRDYE